MTHALSLLAIVLSAVAVVMSVWKTVRMWRAQRRLGVELAKLWDSPQDSTERASSVGTLLKLQEAPGQSRLPPKLSNDLATTMRVAVNQLDHDDRQVLQQLVRQPVEAQARVAVRLATSGSLSQIRSINELKAT